MFYQLNLNKDFDEYEKLIKPLMKEGDYQNFNELNCNTIISWFYKINNDIVGWCCLKYQSKYINLPNSYHLLGNAVLSQYRNKGIGKIMLDYRLDICKDNPTSVCIQPGNISSENLIKSRGFIPGEMNTIWRNWYKNFILLPSE